MTSQGHRGSQVHEKVVILISQKRCETAT